MIDDGLPADAGTPHLLNDVRATTPQYLGAAAEDVLLNASPTAALIRFNERAAAGGRGLYDPDSGRFIVPPGPVPMTSADDANRQYGDLGLKFDAPIATQEAALIADAKKRELQSQATFRAARVDAGEGAGLGLGRSLLSVGTDLVGTAADPINAATMLLPIVGPAGRAVLTANLGRVAGPAVAGAIEGGVGLGLVQPLLTGEALAEQRDTSWWDAAANVVMGGVLGGALGGLHGWFGRAEPSLAAGRLPPEAGGARPPGGPSLEGPPGQPRFGDYAAGWHAALEDLGQRQDLAPYARAPSFDAAAPMVRALSDVSPETRRIAGQTALLQYMAGREIDVEPLLKLDPDWKPPFGDPLDRLRLAVDQRRIAGYLPNPDAPSSAALIDNVPRDVETSAGRYQDFAPGELTVDARRFQFKAGGDQSGVTDRLQGVTKWDQRLAGVGIVWQARDGKLFVVDGHQRHGLATRLASQGQQPMLHSIVLREANGESEGFARALAAFKNVAEGSGSAIDAAKILRETARDPTLKADLAEGRLPPLPPSSVLVRDATALARLPDEAFDVVAAGKVPPNQAAHVTRILSDPKQQTAAIETLARLAPDTSEQARLVVEQMRAAGFREGTTEDLFGRKDVAESLMLERAKILEATARALRKDASVFRTLVERENVAAEAGNVLARDANVERLTDDKAALAVLEALSNRAGPISTALNDGARALADGGRIRGQVDAFLKAVRAESAALKPRVKADATLGDFAALREATGKTDTIGDRDAMVRGQQELRMTPAEHAQSPLALAEHEHARLALEAKQAVEAFPELKPELEAAERAAGDADLFGRASDALAGCKITGGS